MRIGIVVPHVFMNEDILPNVIFSPAQLAIDLCNGLGNLGHVVTLFSPGHVKTRGNNVTADLSYFESELAGRGYGYTELLKKHPLTFISLARQVQSEIIAKAFAMANSDQLDIVHIYTNEEDIALPFAQFCKKPVVFSHHDPFAFLIKYKNNFPKYKHLNWVSFSLSQRLQMPANTNWVGNIYHGLSPSEFSLTPNPTSDYVAFLGRIIQPKGVHLAIKAVNEYNKNNSPKLKLKIAGKHYAGSKDEYWQSIQPMLGDDIEYVGFIGDKQHKQEFLGNAKALIVPSLFEEPFGMVNIEAMACGTPVIGLDSGAIPEVIAQNKTGFIVQKSINEDETAQKIADSLMNIDRINRRKCREHFEQNFTLSQMCQNYASVYKKLLQNN